MKRKISGQLIALVFMLVGCASANAANGWLDAIVQENGRYYALGWTCEPNHQAPINYRLYAGSQSGTRLAQAVTNAPSEPGVAAACNVSGSQYRFRHELSYSLLSQWGGQQLVAVGVSPSGAESLLLGSGKTIPPKPVASIDAPQSCQISAGQNYCSAQVSWSGNTAAACVFNKGTQARLGCGASGSLVVSGISESGVVIEVKNGSQYSAPLLAQKTIVASRPADYHQLMGWLDAVNVVGNSVEIKGWACAIEYESNVLVNLYAGSISASSLIGSVSTSYSSEASVNNACRTSSATHRYRYTLNQQQLKTHEGKNLYAVAVSPVGKADLQLLGSPKALPMAAPTGLTVELPYQDGDGSILGKWRATSAVDRYTVQLKEGASWIDLFSTSLPEKRFNLDKNKQHELRVVACNQSLCAYSESYPVSTVRPVINISRSPTTLVNHVRERVEGIDTFYDSIAEKNVAESEWASLFNKFDNFQGYTDNVRHVILREKNPGEADEEYEKHKIEASLLNKDIQLQFIRFANQLTASGKSVSLEVAGLEAGPCNDKSINPNLVITPEYVANASANYINGRMSEIPGGDPALPPAYTVLALDGPMLRLSKNTGDGNEFANECQFDREQSILAFKTFVQKVTELRPGLRLGVIVQPTNWTLSSEFPSYHGENGAVLEGWHYFDALNRMHTASIEANNRIEFLQIDFPYIYLTKKAAFRSDGNGNTNEAAYRAWASLEALMTHAENLGLDISMVFNTEADGNVLIEGDDYNESDADKEYYTETLDSIRCFYQKYKRLPDVVTIQSWHKNPSTMLSDSTPYSFTNLALALANFVDDPDLSCPLNEEQLR